jgi:hypothetical protein
MRKTPESRKKLATTDSHCMDLKQFFRSWLRVYALAAIGEVTEKELWRNTWLLNVAGYDQFESAKILQTSQPTVSRILSGKFAKKVDV